MNLQNMSNRPSSNEIADRIRQFVQKGQQTPSPPLLHDTTHETLVHAVRKLAQSRISTTLRQLRAVHGFSYEDVAANTGLSKQTLFDLEYKERRLSLDELRLLAACYHVHEDDILGVDLQS